VRLWPYGIDAHPITSGEDVSNAAAVGFWERMSKVQEGGKPPEFLSTHPSDETRIAQIKQWLPEAMKYYKKQ
jgi:predicted Zn-dependent protease